MKELDLSKLSLDELLAIREKLDVELANKVDQEKKALEERLSNLRKFAARPSEKKLGEKRYYPPVSPKYRNPSNPIETWSGRGLKPRWVAEALSKGRTLKDIEIKSSRPLTQEKRKGRNRRR